VNYEQWEATVPEVIRRDVLWRMKSYRLSLFLADLSWHDTGEMVRDRRLISTADQLYRACGKVGACIAEGYSRGTGRDRARFYEYALGSIREARDWYYKSRHCLKADVFSHRIEITSELIRLLLTTISIDRRRTGKPGEEQ
jgi:four helix bundle protein